MKLPRIPIITAIVAAGPMLAYAGQFHFPYSTEKGVYTITGYEGRVDADAKVIDLSRLGGAIYASPLYFEVEGDSVFYGTTSTIRQEYHVVAGSPRLVRSESDMAVGYLDPGVAVMAAAGEEPMRMRGRTYRTDYYFGDGTCTYSELPGLTVIRHPGDTIVGAAACRRELSFEVGSARHPFDNLAACPDSARANVRYTTTVWRDSDARALALAIEINSTDYAGITEQQSGIFIIDNVAEQPSYNQRTRTAAAPTPTATFSDDRLVVAGLTVGEGARIMVADVSGIQYYLGEYDSVDGLIYIPAARFPDIILVTIEQPSDTTTIKLQR